MSVPMVKLAHVEALWSLSADPLASLQALRESAVPGADANETAVILPAGWDPVSLYVDANGDVCCIGMDTKDEELDVVLLVGKSGVNKMLQSGKWVRCDINADRDRFPKLQDAIDALARALEGESK